MSPEDEPANTAPEQAPAKDAPPKDAPPKGSPPNDAPADAPAAAAAAAAAAAVEAEDDDDEAPKPRSPADDYRPPDLPWEGDPPKPVLDVDDVPDSDDGSMSLVGHLEELRARILTCLATLVVGALAAYTVSDHLLKALTAAAPGHKFVFLSPTEAFFTHLSIAFYSGLLLAAPVVVYQCWQFLRPGLTERERRMSRGLFPVVAFFFFGGAAFAFTLILPLGLDFLLGFATNDLQPMLSIQSYTSFVLTFLLVFGLAFELPVVLFVAARMGLVTRTELANGRPYFIVGLVTVSAVLTPPDVATQLLLAFPVWLLFEATLILLRFSE